MLLQDHTLRNAALVLTDNLLEHTRQRGFAVAPSARPSDFLLATDTPSGDASFDEFTAKGLAIAKIHDAITMRLKPVCFPAIDLVLADTQARQRQWTQRCINPEMPQTFTKLFICFLCRFVCSFFSRNRSDIGIAGFRRPIGLFRQGDNRFPDGI